MNAAKQAVMIGGGIVIGMYGIKGMAHIKQLAAHRKYLGAIDFGLGAILAMFTKNRYLESLGLTVAGVGIYDLVAVNVKSLHLPAIHTGSMHPKAMMAEGAVPLAALQGPEEQEEAPETSGNNLGNSMSGSDDTEGLIVE